jgi:protein-tyrosine phosphatase
MMAPAASAIRARRQGIHAAMRVLFVCLGNICRSPTAEAVLRKRAAEHGRIVEVDSAGTGDWHVGNPPDSRAIQAAARRGYDLSGLRARQVRRSDFTDFDLVVAMDRSQLAELRRLAPDHAHERIPLFLNFAPETGRDEVPDPYYGGAAGFDQMIDLIEAGVDGLLDALDEVEAEAEAAAR